MKDDAYNSIILHVVWEHDTEIYRKNNTEIPVLELKIMLTLILNKYQSLGLNLGFSRKQLIKLIILFCIGKERPILNV
jgi:hypothetical protein